MRGKIFILSILLALFASSALAASDELRRELEEQIRQKEAEIEEYRQSITENKQQERTLQNEIQLLENEISKVYLEIKQLDLNIQQSTLNIEEIDAKIIGIEEHIGEQKVLLAEYIRIIAHRDRETLLDVILKNDSFSDLFDEINALENVQANAHATLASIRDLKVQLLGEREELENERQAQNQLKSLQLVQKRTVERKQWQKEDLLDKTQGEEHRYQEMIKGAEKDIAHIKEQMILLERYNLTLTDVVEHAIFAASRTGIRPAFLLGVLEAESRLGLNVGTGNWEDDMYLCYQRLGYLTRASKEKTAFFQICEGLGLNPNLQPVSAEPWYGCGGAMGIGQFMPTTWLAYQDDTAAVTGHNPPSPWDPRDAFVAAAIKLSRGGADQRTEYGERMAYAKYLAGSRWKRWMYHNVVNYVIRLTGNFQEEYFN